MAEMVHSDITGKDYNVSDAIRLLNIKQSIAYLKHGCELLDLYVSKDFETNEPVLCFIFNRKQSKPLFDLWCKHELN